MSHETQSLKADDIVYVADMLRAIVWVKDELSEVSDASLTCLKESLSTAEASLRRVAAEMSTNSD